MSKRELFGKIASLAKRKDVLVRPPYFSDELLFGSECIKCDAACQRACEEGIIYLLDDASPFLSFVNSGCSYCDECAKACEFGVLKIEHKKLIDARIHIKISACLSHNGVMCFACKDPCLENAIDFIGLFKPTINNNCTACGFCISRCPSGAIEVV